MLHVVILAGGWGKRFWPVSTRKRPKQLLSLDASGKTMLQMAFERATLLTAAERVYVCTTRDLAPTIAQTLSLARENLIVEPYARDTAAALALSSTFALNRDPEAVLVSLNSDHCISNLEAFVEVVKNAVKIAQGNRLVILGLRPTRPETGYGYIRIGRRIGRAYRVERFKEKPTRRTAALYLKSGKYLWNSGIFAWRCEHFLQQLSVHMPGLHSAMAGIAQSLGTKDQDAAVRSAYACLPAISIDYGLFEKARGCVAVVGKFGWEDVGSWASLARLHAVDSRGNISLGERKAVLLDSTGCVAFSEGQLVAMIGVKDLVVVSTGKAVLVCRKNQVGRIKELVDGLEAQGLDDYL